MPELPSAGSRADLIGPTTPENRRNRLDIVSNLGRLSSVSAEVGLFVHFLQEPDALLRTHARRTLKSRLDLAKRLIPDLMALLRHTRDDVRWNVCSILSDLGPDAIAALPVLVELEKKNELVASAIWKISKDADLVVPLLGELMKVPNAEVCDLICEIGPDASATVPSLRKAVNNIDANVRWAAVCALGAIGDRAAESIPELVRLLGDESSRVAGCAAHALAKFGSKSIASLIAALQAENPHSREMAADALAQIGALASPAIPFLEKLLSDRQQDVVWWSAIALGRITHSLKMLPLLQQIVDQSVNPYARGRALEAMNEINAVG